ncbi:hypothetical protein [Jiella marina]|uniref:hypothetical protein n=1 Tax=Jiella sp. LLJ827 TaxID=2917712 RepID=UPI002100F162|nr:hypothetical protein [Jiella sp. LLJ827]MCQ0988889.1 hypothetical protein [Jiella sp. LLJ827]
MIHLRTFALSCLSLVAVAAQSASAPAQEITGSGLRLDASPFVAPKPGQNQDAPATLTPRGLKLGELDWAPIDSRCRFVRAEAPGDVPDDAANADRSETAMDAIGAYVFVTMVTGPGESDGQSLERGYVMANSLVRELEKGKTAAGKEDAVVTMWRAAGEPRINVSLALTGAREAVDHIEYTGNMTVFWGDKKENVPIRGRCD